MCSLGAEEVAAVDSCFALVRARQHCIASSVPGYAVLTSSNKSETAVHYCHFLGT